MSSTTDFHALFGSASGDGTAWQAAQVVWTSAAVGSGEADGAGVWAGAAPAIAAEKRDGRDQSASHGARSPSVRSFVSSSARSRLRARRPSAVFVRSPRDAAIS